MFIDIFRGLRTSLIEGCVRDFQQNAAECDQVHPSMLRRASGACQSASGRAMADRSPHAHDRSALKTNFGYRSAKFRDRLLSTEINILTRFCSIFSSFQNYLGLFRILIYLVSN